MFLRFITDVSQQMSEIALVINTFILITTLIVAELYYAERPATERRQLYYFLPIVLVFAGILTYAVYSQVNGGVS